MGQAGIVNGVDAEQPCITEYEAHQWPVIAIDGEDGISQIIAGQLILPCMSGVQKDRQLQTYTNLGAWKCSFYQRYWFLTEEHYYAQIEFDQHRLPDAVRYGR